MTAGRYAQSQAKFADSRGHGAGCELFLVEGDSAARSVVAVRDERTQAVLPLQGKPMNAWRADAAKVRDNLLFRQLADALGLPDPLMETRATGATPLHFERVMLLFDPDADGIHIGALMLLYFARWLPMLIECGQVWMVQAPMFTLAHAHTGETVQAWSASHCDALRAQLQSQAEGGVDVHRHLGLGSIPPAILRKTCIDSMTRQCRRVSQEDVDAVLAVFGRG